MTLTYTQIENNWCCIDSCQHMIGGEKCKEYCFPDNRTPYKIDFSLRMLEIPDYSPEKQRLKIQEELDEFYRAETIEDKLDEMLDVLRAMLNMMLYSGASIKQVDEANKRHHCKMDSRDWRDRG